MSVQAMEHVLAQSLDPNNLELNDIPPEVWAALRTAVPVRGSSLSDNITRSSSFAEARDNEGSGESSPMDDSPTHVASTPLFLPGSPNEGHISTPYHPQSLEGGGPSPHVIGNQQHPIFIGNSIGVITGQNNRYFEAIGLMDTIKDELNQAVEGHSHYFLNEPLTILQDPAFPVQSDELRRILDLAAAALSVGPRANDSDDVWSLLRPTILRGCVQTKNIGCLGNFPLHPLRDTYRRLNNLPELETQHNLLEAIAFQITEHLSLDNGPYLPQDSIDGIRATVWRAHEAQIRMAVSQKANEVEHKLTTMGLAELIDKLLNKALVEEITNTVREDIALQTRSKYNNAKLEAENKAYHELINQAMAEGKDRATKEALETYANTSRNLCEMKERQAKDDAEKYYQNLLGKAKEQARLKADSEFAHLLADERSAIAPRVDTEIVLEHKKLVEECHLATEAQLKALTTEEEKKLKVKVDQCKARPAPVTPRGRSSSIVSNTSQSNSRKRAYSPSEAIAPAPQPDRDEQKTPTPPKEITTVNFEIKAEPTPQPTFPTPSMPSVIRDAVDLAQSVSLCGSTLSIHNTANHMSVDPEHLDLANLFPPGIPPPPINVLLPPAMSQTPQFGGAEAHEDGVAPSILPEVMEASALEIRLFSLMKKFNQPIWDTIHRIEQALGDGRIPRVPQHAGPGYWSEHIYKQATQVSSTPDGPAVTTQVSRERQVSQVAPPLPSEPLVPERPSIVATPIARVDNDEFPEIEPMSRGTRCRRNAAAAVTQQRCNILGATGPDDSHIALTNNNSRIKPLFANIITQAAVARQQTVQQTVAQA
ncbi:hypothetical protein V8E53_005783 [Lactarius tabidus]